MENLKFTKTEDDHLRSGCVKYMKSSKKWSDILNDDAYQFQPGRNRDSLRMRASIIGIDRKRPNSQRKEKNT